MLRVLSAILFSPRGGSAHAARALARGLRASGLRRSRWWPGHAEIRAPTATPGRSTATCARSISTPRSPPRARSGSRARRAARRCIPPSRIGPGRRTGCSPSLDDARIRAAGRRLVTRAGARRSARRRRAASAPPHADQRGRRPRRPPRSDRRPAARHRAADARADRRPRPARLAIRRPLGAADARLGAAAARGWSSPRPASSARSSLLEVPRERLVTVPNGVDVDLFTAAHR